MTGPAGHIARWEERVLGDAAFAWAQRWLPYAHTLGHELMRRLRPDRFAAVSWVPLSVDQARAERLAAGGLGPKPPNDDWLSRQIHDVATAASALIVADPLAQATDPLPSKRDYEWLAFAPGNELYWVARAARQHPARAADTMRLAGGLVACGVVADAPIPEQQLNRRTLRSIAVRACGVILEAYDGESWLVFRRLAP